MNRLNMNRMFRYTEPKALNRLIWSLKLKEKVSLFLIHLAMYPLEGICLLLASIAKVLTYPYEWLEQLYMDLKFLLDDLIYQSTETKNHLENGKV